MTPQSEFEAARHELDHRLAKMAGFLPEKLRLKLNEQFASAVALAKDQTEEAYSNAVEALRALAKKLNDSEPQLRGAEVKHLREKVRKQLANDGALLTPPDLKWYQEAFAKVDIDTPADEEEAAGLVGSLRELSANLDGAIEARIKAISDLAVDFERLTPILKRALSIEHDKHAELEKGVNALDTGFAGDYVKQGLSTDEIAKELRGVESLAEEVFKGFKAEDALKEQKASLPADAKSLAPKGAALGAGAFGEVYSLDNDRGASLVGKSFNATDDTAIHEMEHEAEVYAQIGEHPNIAKCYGIHEVDAGSGAQPMLVMDKIEGPDVEKVFDDLDERYRDGKLSRSEYLAGLQHVMKGTLMGLAHMESMGLVHKDIKGDNIKFDKRTNQATLIDMGLAQAEGAHESPKSWIFIEPPENRAGRQKKDDKVVTTVWDSFSAGTLLFAEMERDDSGERQLLTPGSAPTPESERMMKMKRFTGEGAKEILGRKASGELEAKTDSEGNLRGQALKKEDDPDWAGDAGSYGAETAYVDFMNRLTHPDPSLRMSASEALKHPFMAQALSSEEDMDRIFGPKIDPSAVAAKPAKDKEDDIFSLPEEEGEEDDLTEDDIFGLPSDDEESDLEEDDVSEEDIFGDSGESADAPAPASSGTPSGYNNDELWQRGDKAEEATESLDSSASAASSTSSSSTSDYDEVSDIDEEDEDPVDAAPSAPATPPQPKSEVKQVLARGASPLQMWKIAAQQVEQQFNSAYSNLESDKSALKAAGFTKGSKFSKYFTYNKSLDKLIDKLEKSLAKKTKSVSKDKANVLAATKHYRVKILRKADTDFGWANATPAVNPPFWKTMVEGLDDVDAWVNAN